MINKIIDPIISLSKQCRKLKLSLRKKTSSQQKIKNKINCFNSSANWSLRYDVCLSQDEKASQKYMKSSWVIPLWLTVIILHILYRRRRVGSRRLFLTLYILFSINRIFVNCDLISGAYKYKWRASWKYTTVTFQDRLLPPLPFCLFPARLHNIS